MRKFGARLLAAVIAGTLIAMPVMAAPSISKLKESKAQKQQEVNTLQEELTQIMLKLNTLEEALISKGEEIIQATAALEAAQIREREQYDAMKLRIRYMYEEGNTTALEALLTAENFTDLMNKAEYVQNVHQYDREKLQEYIETKQQIATLKLTLEEEQKQLEALQVEFQNQRVQLSAMIEAKKSEVADLDAQIQAAAEAAARAAEEKRRQEAARKAAEINNNTQTNTSSSNNSSGSNNSSNSNSSNSSNNTGSANTNNNTANNTAGSSSGVSQSAGTGNLSVAQAIVDQARAQLGTKYTSGGSSPGGFDCSGLVQYSYNSASVSVGRTSGEQGGSGTSVSEPQAGDVVCFPGHVGIYIGDGQMIHASVPGDVVKVSSVDSVAKQLGSVWYKRYW